MATEAQADLTAPGEWHTSTSLIGTTKYPEGWTHYDYVNPDAPKGGTLNQPGYGSFDTFNPFVVRGTPAAGFAAFGGGLIYDTLMTQATDEPSVSHALIAEAARWPADFSSVTFRLDPDARFQDGTPITVEDVIWSFETVKRLNPLYGGYYANVTGASETAPGEVTFTFDQTGNRELPKIMGDLVVLPKHWWEGTDAQGRKRDIEQPTLEIPLGSGPYRVANFKAGASITWERVPDYWAADKPPQKGRYNFDRINYIYFRDQAAAFEAFKRGGYQDYRVENSASRWAQGYENFPALADGRVVKTTLPDESIQPMQGFVLNTRRPQFADPRVRAAFTLAFNFEEMNKNILFGLYARPSSYFQNSELMATGLPEGRELEILEPFRAQLPPELFTQPFVLPNYSKPDSARTYLRQAYELLQAAGYERRGSSLVNKETGQPLAVTFLGNDPSFTRGTQPFVDQLRRLGVDASIRIVDDAQYQALERDFDFDIVIGVYAQTISPGNEQRDFFGSAAADRPGSRNLSGIKSPVVDAIIDKIIFAPDRESLVAATKALDRVLLWNHYLVPQWYSPEIRLAYWTKLDKPEKQPADYIGIDPFSFWVKPDAPAAAAPEPDAAVLQGEAPPPGAAQ
ncbi:extracellular solute-binding protein [Antarcticirhabdus aurantiaca]|uniref:extracellular solute-binding protein n=1 Tax=Antarcticirhabdus aurantiaca TaxID=2606717 RepID=UPI003BB4C607